MKHPNSASIRQLLQTLHEAGVEFIVVGGAAATMHGSGTTTEDLDIVPKQTPENIERLLVLLQELDAYFRADAAGRRLKPARSHLEGAGQLLLSTLLGPLDKRHSRLRGNTWMGTLIAATLAVSCSDTSSTARSEADGDSRVAPDAEDSGEAVKNDREASGSDAGETDDTTPSNVGDGGPGLIDAQDHGSVGPQDSASQSSNESGTTPPIDSSDAEPTDAALPGDGTCIGITGGDDWGSQQALHNFWRDDFGLHWVAKRRQAPGYLLLETYDPTSGELLTSITYDDLDVDPVGGAVTGVAHTPSGTVAVSYTLHEDGFEGHYLLLTSVTDPETYHVVQTPWDSLEVAGRSLGWDGEAFVWHGLTRDGELAVARFDEEGEEILPLQVVGFPTTRLWNGFDMLTDPTSGITWMASPGGDAVRVTGTRRDGSPLTPDAVPVIVGSYGSVNPPDNVHVASNSDGELLFTFTMHFDGFVAQRTTNELEEVGQLVRLPIEEYASRQFMVRHNGAAYWRDAWWLLTQNGLGITAHRVDGDATTDTFEVVHYPAREIFEETNDFPNHLLIAHLSATTFEDELWLGFFDPSATDAGGTNAFRVVRVEPDCTHPSRLDDWLADEELE